MIFERILVWSEVTSVWDGLIRGPTCLGRSDQRRFRARPQPGLYMRSFPAIAFLQVLRNVPILKDGFEKIRNKTAGYYLVCKLSNGFGYVPGTLSLHKKPVEDNGRVKMPKKIRPSRKHETLTFWAVLTELHFTKLWIYGWYLLTRFFFPHNCMTFFLQKLIETKFFIFFNKFCRFSQSDNEYLTMCKTSISVIFDSI